MTRTALKKRLDALETALRPPQQDWAVLWHDDPLPPDCDPADVVCLRWPEDLQGGDLSASSPLGIPNHG